MKRDFVREYEEKEVLPVREKVKVAVIGANRGNGTTFVATAAARALTGQDDCSVAFAEIKEGIKGSPLIYDSMAMGKRFSKRNFISFYSMLKKGESVKGILNMEEGINWALLTPEECARGMYLKSIEKLRLINNMYGDIVICDIDDTEDMEDILPDFDKIIFVIDPLPSKLIGGETMLRKIKKWELKNQNVVWVMNKSNKGISKKRFSEHMKIKDFVSVPLVKTESIYTAEYNCRLPGWQRDIRRQIAPAIEEIVEQHIIRR